MAQNGDTREDPTLGEPDLDGDLEAEIRAMLAAPPIQPVALLERIAPARLPRGTRIDDAFVIEERIAQGGMGVVYLARHELLDRAVAIKLCRRRATDAQTERLLREARAMAALDHPHVVKVHHVGVFDDQVYIAMEFVDGGTLGSWCAQELHSSAQLIDAFVAAGQGLVAAHEAGFVHRDFKPENVLRGRDGRVRVGDFGLVSADHVSTEAGDSPGDDAPSTRYSTLSFAGTPHYMAPEQRAGDPVGPAADQYAFCVSLREALEDAERRRVRLGHASAGPSRRVQAALRRGMHRDPAQRHRDMAALLVALRPAPRFASAGRMLGLLGTLGVVSAATWWVAAPEPPPCPSPQPLVDEVWSPARARAVIAAAPELATDHARGLLTSGFDRFAQEWSDTFTQTCEATRLPTPQLRGEARACLDEARAQLDAALDAVVDAGPRGEVRAMQGLYALPTLPGCLDVAVLQQRLARSRSAAQAQRAGVLRLELARIRARVAMKAPYPDVAPIDAAIATARALDDRSALALALLLRARAQASHTDGPHSVSAWLEQAFVEAEAAGDDTLRAEIGSHLVFEIGVTQGRRSEALAWATRTEAVLERLGDRGTAEAGALYDSVGWLHLEGGQLDAATQALQKAERLKLEAFGAEHPSTASTRLTLGRLWIRRRQHARARAALETAQEGYRRSGDLGHPGIARSQLLLAELAEERSDDGEAQRLLTDVLLRWEAEFGPEHPRLIRALNNLGRVRARIGETDGALEAYGRAREMAVRRLGPDDAQTGWALGNEAEGLMAAGAHDDAIEGFTAAIEHMRALPGAQSLESEALAGRAEAYLATGRIWAAREDAQRVLAHCRATVCEPGIVARASLSQARALDAHGDRAAAVALVHTALTQVPRERRTHQVRRRTMQRWLEERSP